MPFTPLVPLLPAVAEVPEVPDVPLVADVPEVPLVPDVPSTPLVPDVPEVPLVPLNINEPVETNDVLLFALPTQTYPSSNDAVNVPLASIEPVINKEPVTLVSASMFNPLSALTYML